MLYAPRRFFRHISILFASLFHGDLAIHDADDQIHLTHVGILDLFKGSLILLKVLGILRVYGAFTDRVSSVNS